MTRVIFVLAALLVVATANLLSDQDLNDLTGAVNELRKETESTLQNLTLNAELTKMADAWNSKCSLGNDARLKFLYATVWMHSNHSLLAKDWIGTLAVLEQAHINQFVAHELSSASNWTRLMWANSTKIGFSVVKCGSVYSFAAVLSPKGGFPGILPFKPTCKPTHPFTTTCEKVGSCGKYYDGCVEIVCGPPCRGNNTHSSRSDPQRKMLAHTRVRIGNLFETNEDFTKRAAGTNAIWSGEALYAGQAIVSPNRRFVTVQQSDGNLVLYDSQRGALWYTSTYYPYAVNFATVMQGDGNLVMYNLANGQPMWYTRTSGHGNGPFALVQQDDGNLVLYSTPGVPQWYTGTVVPAGGGGFDWRQNGIVTPIKNQGQCGSCWAFAASETIESDWALRHGALPSVSAEQVLSCTGAGSCGGGYPTRVFDWSQGRTFVTEGQFPYQTAVVGCPGLPGTSVGGTAGQNPNRYYANGNQIDQGTIMNYLRANGPHTILIMVENPFMGYAGGVFRSGCASGSINHAVVLVGWGSDGGGDFWIIRNSWDTWWGEGGYVRMARGQNLCSNERFHYGFIPN